MTNGTGTFKNASGSMGHRIGVNLADFAGQDPDVYFYGEVIEKLGPRRYRLTRGAFTTCVQPTPRWQMTTSSATINLDDYAFARNTVLKVKGVPVLLPAGHLLPDSERRTRHRIPDAHLRRTSIRGQAMTNGFFWAIGRSQDATFVHDWYTRSGRGAGGEYRYVAGIRSAGQRSRLLASRGAKPRITETGSQLAAGQQQLPGDGHGQPDDRTHMRARGFVDYFSDILTQKLYNQNVYQATQSRRTIEGSLSGNFGVTSTSALFQRTEYLTDTTSSQRVRQHAAHVGGRRAADALRHAHLRLGEHRLRAHPQPAGSSDGVVTSDRTLNKRDLAPMLRAPLSRLTFLSANASASLSNHLLLRARATPTTT